MFPEGQPEWDVKSDMSLEEDLWNDCATWVSRPWSFLASLAVVLRNLHLHWRKEVTVIALAGLGVMDDWEENSS